MQSDGGYFYPKHKGNTWLPKAGYMGFKNKFEVPNSAGNIPRFSMLVIGMFCSIAMSAVYSFSLITEKLQSDFGFNQNDITTISTVGIVIGYMTLPFGFIYDYIGPKPIFVLGIVFNVIGTLLFALSFDEKIGHSVGGLAIINAVLNLGSSMFDMAGVLSVLSWFPLDRGLVIACMKTMTGLGSSIVATLYSTFFNGDNAVYMYFLLAFSVFIGLIGIAFVHLPVFHMTGWRTKHFTEDERVRAAAYMSVYMRERAPIKRFIIALTLVIALLILLCTRSVVFVFINNPTKSQMNPPAIIMIVLCFCLLFVTAPLRWLDVQPDWYDRESREENARREQEARAKEAAGPGNKMEPVDVSAGVEVDLAEKVVEPMEVVEEDNEQAEEKPRGCWQRFKAAFNDKRAVEVIPEPRNREEAIAALALATEMEKIAPQFPTGFLYNIRRPTLICMWFTGIIIVGQVFVVNMNSTQIYIAVSESSSDKQIPSLYVSLTSIGSAVGRLVMAFIEVGLSRIPAERRLPITMFYTVPPCLCFLSSLLFIFVPAHALIAPMLLAGMANGFYAACEVLTARTIFSVDISKHYNSLFFAEMLGVIFFNRLMFGEIMTKNSTVVDGSPVCYGRNKCIRISFIILLVLSAVAAVTGTLVFLTYWRYSKREVEKRRVLRKHLESVLAGFEGRDGEQEEGSEKNSGAATTYTAAEQLGE